MRRFSIPEAEGNNHKGHQGPRRKFQARVLFLRARSCALWFSDSDFAGDYFAKCDGEHWILRLESLFRGHDGLIRDAPLKPPGGSHAIITAAMKVHAELGPGLQ